MIPKNDIEKFSQSNDKWALWKTPLMELDILLGYP